MRDDGPTYVEDQQGAAVVAATYALVAFTLALAIVRFYATRRRKHQIGFDGCTFLLANFLAIVQSILIDRAAHHGLGKHVRDLSPSAIDSSFKFNYLAQLLAVAAQGLAKVTFVSVIARLDSSPSTQRKCYIILVLCLTWILFALFTIAFQCGLPRPWAFDRKRCTAGGNLYYLIIVLNILTDAILSLFFLPVIWKLRIERADRLTVMALFGSRVLVCGFAIGSASVLHSYILSSDITFDAVVPAILNQIVMNLSIITAGLPNVHRFLAEFQTGQINAVIPTNEFNMSTVSKPWHRLHRTRRSANDGVMKTSSEATIPQSQNTLKLMPDNYGESSTYISVTTDHNSLGGGSTHMGHIAEDDITDDGSTRTLNRNAVRRTREVIVGYE